MRKATPADHSLANSPAAPSPALSGSDLLLWSALPDLTLNIAQTASLCGVSVRQLGYWTKQGYITAAGVGARRLYGPEALRRVLAIRLSMQNGLSLRQSLRALEGGDPSAPAAARAVMPHGLTPGVAEAVSSDLLLLFAHNPVTRDSAPGLAAKLGRSVEAVRDVVERLAARGVLSRTYAGGEAVYVRAEGSTL